MLLMLSLSGESGSHGARGPRLLHAARAARSSRWLHSEHATGRKQLGGAANHSAQSLGASRSAERFTHRVVVDGAVQGV